jgi:hypothetical protein
MHSDSACYARVNGGAATATRKTGDMERVAILEACIIRVLGDRESVGRKVFEVSWNVPCVGSHCTIDAAWTSQFEKTPSRTFLSLTLDDVSRGQSADSSALKELNCHGSSVVL